MEFTVQNAIKGVDPTGRGIGIACRYFWEIGLPELESGFPSCIDRFAAGLVAAWSECSDGSPWFQVFLSDSDFAQFGSGIQTLLDQLPKEYSGACCASSGGRAGGVYSTDGFYSEKTGKGNGPGFSRAPETAMDWLRIPESSLFDICHGQVFYDPVGDFTERRREFGAYYPQDAWLKRIAAACYRCGEEGQRILPAAFDRGDYYTAEMAWWRFAESAMRLGFLLNREYAPSLEWLYREFSILPEPFRQVANLLWQGQCDIGGRMALAGDIASIYGSKLEEMGFGRSESLVLRARDITASITDPKIAQLATRVDLVTA